MISRNIACFTLISGLLFAGCQRTVSVFYYPPGYYPWVQSQNPQNVQQTLPPSSRPAQAKVQTPSEHKAPPKHMTPPSTSKPASLSPPAENKPAIKEEKTHPKPEEVKQDFEEPKEAEEKQAAPSETSPIPAGKMARRPFKPYNSVVIPFTEQCLEKEEDKEEPTVEWGKISPWIYKDQTFKNS